MHIAIVDGNTNDTEKLLDIIHSCQGLFHNNLQVDSFATGESLLQVYKPRKFDIIFLDVHLEGINGIETVERIRMQDKVSKIVFLTDSPEYAITAFRLRAFHYLLKPFQEDEIQSLLYECTAQLPDTRQYILVKEGHFEKKIFCRDIDYLWLWIFQISQNKERKCSMSIFVKLLENVIMHFYNITNDYGIAIVCITVLVKVILLPLNIKQRKQMEKQSALSEQVEDIKRRCKNDNERLNKELSELYAKNGVGMGTCLTTLIQFPMMICLYNAIKMIADTTCGTILIPWISSLLLRDPYYVLPIVTIIIQILPQLYPYLSMFKVLNLQKQSKGVMVSMMIMSSVFIFTIPSGIGIYYFASSLFTAVEQFVINFYASKRLAIEN